MTKLAYLDCQTGIAGDMCLGALVAAGVPLDYLIDKLAGLGIQREYRLWVERVHRNGQLATKVHVDLVGETQHLHPEESHREHAHHHDNDSLELSSEILDQTHHHHSPVHAPTRHLPEIEQLITAGNLPPRVVEWSLAVFRNLAVAEGAVHGISPEEVHFHEVGATDALVDIVGTCLGLDWLGIDKIYCSSLPIGSGTVWAAHGRLPVPVPAVLKLWESRQVPVYSNGIEGELVTPTGAALAVTLATEFGSPPPMSIQQVGHGAGSRELPIPNILRLWIGEASPRPNGLNWQRIEQQTWINSPLVDSISSTTNSLNIPLYNLDFSLEPKRRSGAFLETSNHESWQETVCVLETQIDDLSPQAIGYVFEVLFNAGALDVFTQAIGMKKSRPGILLTVICPPEKLTVCEDILFRETTTLGIRHFTQQRTILEREIQEVQTNYGLVRIKVASRDCNGEKVIANIQPEYEDCAAIARTYQLSWREVHQMAVDAWYRQQGSVVR
ncbi:MAG TPA: nickel pincer cofactor biosynthesis protein LarC [Cyanobacteria bacterium UBA12227]|nr:nickel pincer cofactor biosynthesis protein LarC [Cyanobacteria bacterium UBA12227]HAX85845.1 nickel pincer cofactor biosynthesis protein LarC [Cyanobacteria bacterium UBA11370]HBY76023.1 nickel pincer cofactor biosynthesis protein LarC [Cyanobacteria bacterium UBA11148]